MKVSELFEYIKTNKLSCFNCFYSYYNRSLANKLNHYDLSDGCLYLLVIDMLNLDKDTKLDCTKSETHILSIKPKLFNYYKLFI